MNVRISSDVLHRVIADAAASSDEICGLLFGPSGTIEAAHSCRNVAADPRRRFEIDPAALLAAHRATRAGGPKLIGCYHSHPTGDATPSARDAADAEPNGWLWLIVGAGEARVFRAVEAGALHGRFDEHPLVIPAKAATHLASAGAGFPRARR